MSSRAPSTALASAAASPSSEPRLRSRVCRLRWAPLRSDWYSDRRTSLDAGGEKGLNSVHSGRPRRDPTILRRSLMHNLRQQADGSWKWKYDRRRFQRLDQDSHRAERAALADGLARITCPTLVVRGGESDVFHEEDGIRLAQRLPDGKFVTVPRAGHTVQGDNPKDLVAELRRFLAKDN